MRSLNATYKYANCRTRHIARDTISNIKLSVPNWYINGSFVEAGSGGNATVTAAIEYQGVFTQLLFSGVASTVIADGASIMSDFAAVSIPKDNEFFVRIFWHNDAGILFAGNGTQDTSNGDLFQFSSGVLSDMSLGGTISNSSPGNTFGPSAILAYTKRPSVVLLGDSRLQGIYDTFTDNSGDKGEIDRGIGPYFGYISIGVPSDTAQNFIASHAQRVALGQYCSHLILQYGINDLAAGRLDSEIQADCLTIAGYFPTAKKIITTMPPSTTGAWTLVDLSDQTVKAQESRRTANNDWRRSASSGFDFYFEIADVVESSRNSGKWKADGTPAKYTSDGVHETNFANLAIRDSGAIDVSRIRR